MEVHRLRISTRNICFLICTSFSCLGTGQTLRQEESKNLFSRIEAIQKELKNGHLIEQSRSDQNGSTATEELWFTATNGHLISRSTTRSNNPSQPISSVDRYEDATGVYRFSPDHETLFVTARNPHIQISLFLDDVYSSLLNLPNITIDKTPEGYRVKGEQPGQTSTSLFEYRLDRDLVPVWTSSTVQANGQSPSALPLTVHKYEEIKTVAGVKIPMKEVTLFGDKPIASGQIISISLSKPNERDLEPNLLTPRLSIIDHRFPGSVVWNRNSLLKANRGGLPLNLKRLWQLSQIRAHETNTTRKAEASQRKAALVEKSIQEGSSNKINRTLFMVLGGAVLLVAAFVFSASKTLTSKRQGF